MSVISQVGKFLPSRTGNVVVLGVRRWFSRLATLEWQMKETCHGPVGCSLGYIRSHASILFDCTKIGGSRYPSWRGWGLVSCNGTDRFRIDRRRSHIDQNCTVERWLLVQKTVRAEYLGRCLDFLISVNLVMQQFVVGCCLIFSPCCKVRV